MFSGKNDELTMMLFNLLDNKSTQMIQYSLTILLFMIFDCNIIAFRHIMGFTDAKMRFHDGSPPPGDVENILIRMSRQQHLVMNCFVSPEIPFVLILTEDAYDLL